jgi:DNA-binding FadR family transcriptional regulator
MSVTSARLAQPRLHRQLVAILVEAILRGDYAPGDVLPREVDLVETYGVSRGVVREAIRGLEEGSCGTRVIGTSSASTSSPPC